MNRRNFFRLLPCLACVPLIKRLCEKKVVEPKYLGKRVFVSKNELMANGPRKVWVHDDANGYRHVTIDEFNEIFVNKDTPTSSLWKW